jgi:hypothetical protein
LCHVAPPDDLEHLPARPKGFVSALVYKGDLIIGYLDRDGVLVLPNDSDVAAAERELNLYVTLLALEVFSGLLAVVATLALFAMTKKVEGKAGRGQVT